MKIVASFSERLIEAMGAMGVTELAIKLGISKQSVSAYVNGVRQPKQLTIRAIADILNVHPAWLMGYDVEKYASDADKKRTIEVDSELIEFIEMFTRLSAEQRAMVVASMKGILNNE